MELIDRFNSSQWAKADPSSQSGFEEFRIATRAPIGGAAGAGNFQYALFDSNGDVKKVNLSGAGKKDPLSGVGRLEIKLGGDGRQVVGIILEDECVLYNG
jgi:hypothetical protein